MKNLPAMIQSVMARAGYLLGAAVVCAACGGAGAPQPVAAPAPQPAQSAPQPTPAALAALAGRARPCETLTNAAAASAPAEAPTPPAAGLVHYDNASNTIVLRKGADTTLAGVRQALGTTETLQELAPGEWLLNANLRLEAGARMRVAAPEVRWLKLRSSAAGFVSIKALGGQIEFADTCVTSWDPVAKKYDDNYQDGRSFVLARDGARLDIQRSDLRYLGYDGPEAYGLAWRVHGTTGQIVDSFVSYNFYGVYSFEVDDLLIRGNETAHNVMYGIDPHTRSNHLVIEGNVSHDNGKHGIILAEECSDGVIRNNVVYNNLHHGIVIFQRSNNNLVEGNVTFGNGGQGINVNDSTNTIVRGNTTYDNLEAGIGVGQHASATQVIDNKLRANRADGIVFYSDAENSLLRDNQISSNARYGVYVKSEGKLSTAGNLVTDNTVGVYLNTAGPSEFSEQANQVHGNHATDLQRSSDPAPAVEQGDET